ncbi:hypothetical protein ACHQM5_012288 [Ranunculus cassubicifolius]
MIRSKVKPLISSLSSLNHQFLQRCSVSKTAKGKGKTKDGAPLKRSIIPKKKGAKPPGSGAGGAGPERKAAIVSIKWWIHG